jgi:hypothetical protein
MFLSVPSVLSAAYFPAFRLGASRSGGAALCAFGGDARKGFEKQSRPACSFPGSRLLHSGSFQPGLLGIPKLKLYHSAARSPAKSNRIKVNQTSFSNLKLASNTFSLWPAAALSRTSPVPQNLLILLEIWRG